MTAGQQPGGGLGGERRRGRAPPSRRSRAHGVATSGRASRQPLELVEKLAVGLRLAAHGPAGEEQIAQSPDTQSHEDAEVGTPGRARDRAHVEGVSSAITAATEPSTWATIPGQWIPPLRQYDRRPVRLLQFRRHVPVATEHPVDEEDGAPRRDPADHHVDEVVKSVANDESNTA